MKTFFKTALQFVLFFVTFLAGSLFAPLHLQQTLSSSSEGTRVFVWDGLLLMTALFLVILLIEQLRKRIVAAGPWTTLACILATAVGLAAKVGFLTIER